MLATLSRALRALVKGETGSSAAIQSLVTKFLVLAVNASTSILVARLLKPEGRGEMSALMIWSGFLGSMITLGLPSSLIYNLKKGSFNPSLLSGAGLTIAALLSLAIGVIGVIALPFWLHSYPPSAILAAQWFLLSSPVPVFLLVGRAAMESSGKFLQSNMSAWAGPALTLFTLAILAMLHVLTPVTGALAYVAANVPVVFWLIRQVWTTYKPVWPVPLNTYSTLLHYGLRSWGIDLLNALALQADQVLVVRFLTPKAMGIYVVAAGLARLLSAFQTSAVMVLLPRVAARSTAEVLRITGRTLRIATAAAVVGAVLVSIAGPFLLSTLYGWQYANEGAAVFRLLLLEVVISGATQILAQAFMALGRPGTITLAQAVGVGASLWLMPILIPTYGALGAAMALVVSSVIRYLLTLLAFPFILGQRIPNPILTLRDIFSLSGRIRAFTLRPAD